MTWKTAVYKGYTGTIVGKQTIIEGTDVETNYLVAFSRPSDTTKRKEYAETFGLDPEKLGPSVNRLIPEKELTINER